MSESSSAAVAVAAACHQIVGDLKATATTSEAFAQLTDAGQTLNNAVSLLRARSYWMNKFGELILCCGAPPIEKDQFDIPFALEVSKLLTLYEHGMGQDTSLDSSARTITYLWLKSFASLGHGADHQAEVEGFFQRWIMQSADPSESANHAELILLGWLRRWGLDACELLLWDFRHQTRPGSVTGQNNVRRRELRHKLIHRVHLPHRPAGVVLVGYREKAGYKDIEEEAKSHVTEEQPLPVFLLQRPQRFGLDDGVRVADDTRLDVLLPHLAESLRNDLSSQIECANVVPVRVDLGKGSLQAEQPWLTIIPKNVDSLGLHGAGIWVRVDLTRIADRSNVSYIVFGGVEPAGLSLESFLRVVRVIKEQQDQELLKILNNVDNVISATLSDQAKLVSRAALTSSVSDTGRPAI